MSYQNSIVEANEFDKWPSFLLFFSCRSQRMCIMILLGSIGIFRKFGTFPE